MLSQKYRLSASFFRTAHIAHRTPFCSVVLRACRVRLYSSEYPFSRFSCVVRNGVFRNVVERNKWKRFFYERIRKDCLHTIPGFDVVVSIYTAKGTEDQITLDVCDIKKAMTI